MEVAREMEIFCPNCGRFVGRSEQCEHCRWSRPAAPASRAGQLLWETPPAEQAQAADASVFLTRLMLGGGLLFAATAGGEVAAFDPQTGQPVWRRTLHPERKLRAQAAVPWRDLVWIGAQNLEDLPSYRRSLLAWHAETGADAWSWPTQADNLSTPLIREDTLYFISSEPRVYALDLESRRLRWSAPCFTWSPEPPACEEDILVAPSRSPRVTAYQVDSGQSLWTFSADDLETELLHHSPAISAGTVYLSGWGKRLYAVDLSSGALRWRFTARRGITCPPVAAGDRVLVAVKDIREGGGEEKPCYSLMALDSGSGEAVWKFTLDRHIYTMPVVVGETVLFGADDRRLHALDLASGSELWQLTTADKLRASPCVAGDRVWIGQRDERMICVQWQESRPVEPDPAQLLADGQHLAAAAALALAGRYAEAARIYQDQDRPHQAAALYQEAGLLADAVKVYVALENYEAALSLCREAGDRRGEARILSLQGCHADAAGIYEEVGDLEQAARAYVEAGRAGYAAILLWKMGRRVEAAELFQMVNQDDQAAEVLVEDRQFARAAEIYLRLGKPDAAAGVLAQGGLFDQAAAVNEQAGQLKTAAEQYAQAGQTEQALRLYEQLGDWQRTAALAEKCGDLLRQATALVHLGQLEYAAALFQQAGQPELALDQLEACGRWEKAAVLAGQLGQWQRQGAAFSSIGMMTQAGEAYEQAARALLEQNPAEMQPVAAMYEAAAQCYAEDDDWLRLDACMNKVCQFRGWPYLKPRFELTADFFQSEYSLITLEVQNVGYSPANNIQVRGISQKFHIDEGESQVFIRLLGVRQDRNLRLMLQPRPGVLGQVLLRVELIYLDASGGEHKATCEQTVKVLGRDEKVNALDTPARTPISDSKITEEVVRLTRGLVEYFNDEEIQDLCYVHLQLEYEDLRGETKSARARELVLLMRRYGRLAELRNVLQQLRPHGTW